MRGFNLEGLAKVHAIVEHALGLFGELEGRFRSTQHAPDGSQSRRAGRL